MKWMSLVLLLVLVSCNSSDEKAANKSNSDTYIRHFISEPTTLNPQSSTDYNATLMQVYISDTLTYTDPDTYEPIPALAESWEVSEDGMKITFNLRKGVKWHDGKPFTAEDVKFSFDAVKDPTNKYKTAHTRPYFENFDKAVIENPHRISFIINTKYFGNFDVLAGRYMAIVPKHIYENPNKDEKKVLNRTMIGNGAYIFKKWRRGKDMLLVKNPEWWGNKVYPQRHTIPQMRMKFIKDGAVALQRLEKGDIDSIWPLSSEEYAVKAKGKKWGKEVFKVKAKNSSPKRYSFIGWNLTKDMFKSKNTRLALYKLIDRDSMIKKFTYGLSLKATGPWYRQSPYADPNVKPVEFDPQGALELLKKDGWSDSDGDQVLDKMVNGVKKSFEMTILIPNKDFSKYMVIFQQAAKKVGVKLDIKLVEWNTFIKLLDERNFDAVVLSWNGGSVNNDPKQIWHSSSARPGGSNFISYKNPEVDKLIDEARLEIDKKKRIPLLQKVYRMIANDAPYAFLFVPAYDLYARTKKIGTHKDTYVYDIEPHLWFISNQN